jgi:hypothetical protein
MIKLVASFGMKVPGEQEYSSRSYHATAEVEVADGLVNKPDALKAALHALWGDLKAAVAEEIHGGHVVSSNGNGAGVPNRISGSNGNGHHGGNGNGRRPEPVNRINNNVSSVPASKKQIGFLLSLTRRKRNFNAEQTREWLRTERNLNLNTLSKREAGVLIDELNEAKS